MQAKLGDVSLCYRDITCVRHYGRNGIICKSGNLSCVRELLRRKYFSELQVNAFFPACIACVKGIVRGVDTSVSSADVLDLFPAPDASSLY